MALFGNEGGPWNNIHGDVLNAHPEEESSLLALIEECKRRAKSSLSAKNFPEAIALYTKAVEVCPKDKPEHANALAILHSNRSLAYLSMNKIKEAREDADRAIAVDPTYLKGHFRKVMALIAATEYGAARQLIVECLERQPNDPDLVKQLAVVEEKLRAAPPPAKTTVKVTSTLAAPAAAATSSPAPAPKASTSTPAPAAPSSAAAAAAESSTEETDDAAFSASDKIRGYKLTSDGRKTTFFNNELDEETKKLIGNIAPKKLDPTTAEVAAAPTVAGASVWNSAGTFESVDHSVWARERIKEVVSGVPAVAAGGGFVAVRVKAGSVKVDGDAQTTMMRGKRKQICDFTVDLDWVAEPEGGGAALEGQLTITDVTADKEWEFASVLPAAAAGPQRDALKKRLAVLEASLARTLDNFFAEFAAK